MKKDMMNSNRYQTQNNILNAGCDTEKSELYAIFAVYLFYNVPV